MELTGPEMQDGPDDKRLRELKKQLKEAKKKSDSSTTMESFIEWFRIHTEYEELEKRVTQRRQQKHLKPPPAPLPSIYPPDGYMRETKVAEYWKLYGSRLRHLDVAAVYYSELLNLDPRERNAGMDDTHPSTKNDFSTASITSSTEGREAVGKEDRNSDHRLALTKGGTVWRDLFLAEVSQLSQLQKKMEKLRNDLMPPLVCRWCHQYHRSTKEPEYPLPDPFETEMDFEYIPDEDSDTLSDKF